MNTRVGLAAVAVTLLAVACTSDRTAMPTGLVGVPKTSPSTAVAPGTSLTDFVIFPSIINGSGLSEPTVYLFFTPSTVDRTVQITTDNPAVTTPFPTAVLLADSTALRVGLGSVDVAAPTVVTVTVTGSDFTVSAPVTVYPRFATLPPATLSKIVVNPLTVAAGATPIATLALAAPAPSGGLVVMLGASPSTSGQVQPTVTVPAGATSVTFPVTTFVGFPNSTTTVDVNAYQGDSSVHTGVNVVTGAVPVAYGTQSLQLTPDTVVGGATVKGIITMNGAAPSGGSVITLQSSDPSTTTPASVTLPAGASSASFTINTRSVSAPTFVNISAGFGGNFLTSSLTVNPASSTPVTPPPAATLSAPSLISPAADARFPASSTVNFDWSDVTGAGSYTIEISDNSSFPTFIVNQVVAASQLSISTLPTKTMWVRVRANSSSGAAGPWSSSRRFELK